MAAIDLIYPIPRPIAETPLGNKMSRRTPVSTPCPPSMSTPLESVLSWSRFDLRTYRKQLCITDAERENKVALEESL